MAKYSSTSPYFATPQNNINLETFIPRTITAEGDDQSYTIERTYAYPIYDFKPGVSIKLPKPGNISQDLGV